MKNIGGVNVDIIKRPIVEDAESDYKNYIYPVTAFTQSQKKI